MTKLAVVLMHSPAALWTDALKANPRAFSKPEADAIIENAADEKRFLQGAGIDPALLECVARLEHPNFTHIMRYRHGIMGDDQLVGNKIHVGGNRYGWVDFSARALQHYGVAGLQRYWMPVSVNWRRDPEEGGKVAWVDGGPGHWCKASAGAPGPEPGMEGDAEFEGLHDP